MNVSADESASPSVSDVKIDTKNFELAADKETMRGWWSPSGDAVILFLELLPSDLPFDKNTMEEFIASLQEQFTSNNASLVECATSVLDGFRGFTYIFKYLQEDGGVGYSGDVSIHFREHYYHYRIECKERGVTGARESKALVDALIEGRAEKDQEGLVQITSGPDYEDRKYDEIFPEHPLSRVRRLIDHIHKTVSTSDKLAGYELADWPRYADGIDK